MNRLSLVFAVLWVTSSSPAHAGYIEDYKNGLAAARKGEWELAMQFFSTAVEGRAQASRRVVALSLQPYVPHYRLGEALYHLDECPRAVEAFEESKRQGVVLKLDALYQRLGYYQGQCAVRTVPVPVPPEPAYPSVEPPTSSPSDAREEPAPRRTEEPARRFVSQGLPAVHGDASEAAQTAERSERGEWDLRAMADEAREVLDSIPDRGLAVPMLAVRRAQIERLLRAIDHVDPEMERPRIASLSSDLERLLELLRRRLAAPPPILIESADRYFAGDYAGALALLDGFENADFRARAHAHLLRAASRFALARLSGDEARQHLEAARWEVVACRRADALVPQPTAFSPAFVRFFERVSRAQTADRGEPP